MPTVINYIANPPKTRVDSYWLPDEMYIRYDPMRKRYGLWGGSIMNQQPRSLHSFRHKYEYCVYVSIPPLNRISI